MTGSTYSRGEQTAIDAGLQTRASLAADLRALGLDDGATVLVHASLSRLGWVCGGSVAVVQALLDVLGPRGTLVVPTHSTQNSDPSGWRNPSIPAEWWPAVREAMPGYHAKVTPTRAMGVIADTVRTWPVARRSAHPTYSFAAVGPLADELTSAHALSPALGTGSPLGKLRDVSGQVLLLGVGHERNTSLHLAEYAHPAARQCSHAAATSHAGDRRWTSWQDLDFDSSDFSSLGAAYDATGATRIAEVGAGEARLMTQPDLVAFAERWLESHRVRTA